MEFGPGGYFWSALADAFRTVDYISVFEPIEIIAQNIRELLTPETPLFC